MKSARANKKRIFAIRILMDLLDKWVTEEEPNINGSVKDEINRLRAEIALE